MKEKKRGGMWPWPFHKKKKRAEESALQPDQKALQQNLLLNQMNPHFLYNTLESIRGKAIADGNVQVADMVEALSAFFRYNVSYRSGVVALADELNNVNEYIKIQNFRFSDRFRFVLRIDEGIDANAWYLPKLTLQPIVENAIMHGLEELEEGGTVTLRVMDVKDHLLLSIADNGAGMDEETLRSLCSVLGQAAGGEEAAAQDENRRGGIALMNIQKRIQLFFGSEYGLSIYSTENVGTTVELLIPKRDAPVFAGRTENQ